jgi:hypothetical protein
LNYKVIGYGNKCIKEDAGGNPERWSLKQTFSRWFGKKLHKIKQGWNN